MTSEQYYLLLAIIAVVVCIVATLIGVVVYSGLFHPIEVGAGTPPVPNVVVAYKFERGPYKQCGQLFTEVCRLAPFQKSVGIYYDDPHTVEESKLRYIVGAILSEGDEKVDEGVKNEMVKEGYKIVNLPKVSNCVKTIFPHKTTLSIYIAVARVYPQLGYYIDSKKLCAHPMLEIYDGENIYYMAPLSKQDQFYVPECKEKEEIHHDNAESDLNSTADSNTDISSFISSPDQSLLSFTTDRSSRDSSMDTEERLLAELSHPIKSEKCPQIITEGDDKVEEKFIDSGVSSQVTSSVNLTEEKLPQTPEDESERSSASSFEEITMEERNL